MWQFLQKSLELQYIAFFQDKMCVHLLLRLAMCKAVFLKTLSRLYGVYTDSVSKVTNHLRTIWCHRDLSYYITKRWNYSPFNCSTDVHHIMSKSEVFSLLAQESLTLAEDMHFHSTLPLYQCTFLQYSQRPIRFYCIQNT